MLNRRLNVNVSKSLERLTLYQPPLPMRAHTSTCTHTRGQSPLQISARAPRLFGDEGVRRWQSWGHRGPASPPATLSLPAAPSPALELGDAAGCRGSRGHQQGSAHPTLGMMLVLPWELGMLRPWQGPHAPTPGRGLCGLPGQRGSPCVTGLHPSANKQFIAWKELSLLALRSAVTQTLLLAGGI